MTRKNTGDGNDNRDSDNTGVASAKLENDEQRDPRYDDAIDVAADRLGQCLAVAAAVKVAPPRDEPRPDQYETGERPQRKIRPDTTQHSDT